jgi:hypothetical protein
MFPMLRPAMPWCEQGFASPSDKSGMCRGLRDITAVAWAQALQIRCCRLPCDHFQAQWASLGVKCCPADNPCGWAHA